MGDLLDRAMAHYGPNIDGETASIIADLITEIIRLQAEASELRQAVGLATTLAPHVVMNPEHPLEMMRKVVAHVSGLQAVLDAARGRCLKHIANHRSDHDEELWGKMVAAKEILRTLDGEVKHE